jgi:hypothetical protein
MHKERVLNWDFIDINAERRQILHKRKEFIDEDEAKATISHPF